MRFSTRTRYGIRAMIEIARNSPVEGIYQKEIAERQGISVKYLDQIIQSLKTAGLIRTVRGRKSGYMLTRSPEEITMLDIHNAFEPGICVIDCLTPGFECDRQHRCVAKGFWGGLNQRIIDYFSSMTLKDMIDDRIPLEDAVGA